MAEYLVFRLYGPMCSWGEIAVGESRHTADHPSRSALLGLFAAALGIERGQEERQQQLSDSWSFGVKLLTPGMLLRDYHTVQAPKRQKGVRHRTRRSELMAPEVNTLLSSREYRTDSISIVAAQARPNAGWTPAQMQAALQRPCFPLYLGRKSCPLALPLTPQIMQAPSLRAALDSPQKPLTGLEYKGRVKKQADAESASPTQDEVRLFRIKPVRYFWEESMDLEPAATDAQKKTFVDFVRNDQPLSRKRWQFTRRTERAYLTEVSQPPKEAEA